MSELNLKVGQKVVFSKTPLGSYTKLGDVYEIERITDGAIYFRNVKTGGGTFDKVDDVKLAQFTIVE